MTENEKFKTAYDAGFDAGRNAPNTDNSHFKWFANEDLMLEWSRGNKDGISEKTKADKYSGNAYNQLNKKINQ